MTLPIGVLLVFAALCAWVLLAVWGTLRGRWLPPLLFGIALMLALNMGYVINGPVASIANFIGIYDVLINLGLNDAAVAVMPCPDNACTVWGDRYTLHPAWGAAFHARFATGSDARSALLMAHIVCNSLVFVLMHVQMFRPGGHARRHALIGRLSFVILTVGVGCAALLASQHGSVREYGGEWAKWGFFSMSVFVYACAVFGVLAIRRGDAPGHRVWMWRFAGSMWGSFWVFRVLLFVIDPLLRDVESAAILTCIWGSAPAGILIAELIRRRLDAAKASPAASPLLRGQSG